MPEYRVWVEGYSATGDEGQAWLKGIVIADSFERACACLFGVDPYFNASKLTYWACRLYDNEDDARRTFG